MDHSQKAVTVFDQFALAYQEQYMDVSLYHDSLDFFCSQISQQHVSILELACGPGNVTKYLQETRPDFNILATDMSPQMLRLTAKNVPEVKTLALDARKIHSLDEEYQGIVASFCLPYLAMKEVNKLIADSFHLLSNNGMLYLSTMEKEYKESGYQKGSKKEVEPIFMHFYTESDLNQLLTQQNFKLIYTDRKQYKDATGSLVTDLILIAKKVQHEDSRK